MLPPLRLRREGHDPSPPRPDEPEPNDPIETPKGADPGPDPDAPHAPEPESTPVV